MTQCVERKSLSGELSGRQPWDSSVTRESLAEKVVDDDGCRAEMGGHQDGGDLAGVLRGRLVLLAGGS